MPIISLKELSSMEPASIIQHWNTEQERARSAFLVMGKLTYITSQRLEGKALRQWKRDRNLSKGSAVRANTTSRFIELFVATGRVSEERFDSITWQVIEAVKKLLLGWRGLSMEDDRLNELGGLVMQEVSNAKLLKVLEAKIDLKTFQKSPAKHSVLGAVNGMVLNDEFIVRFKEDRPDAYPMVNGVYSFVRNHEEQLKAVGVKFTVVAQMLD